MYKLIDAANKYEDKEYYVVDGNYTSDAIVNAFLSGANWQNNNMWNLANKKHEIYVPTKAFKCRVFRKGLSSGAVNPVGELITLNPNLGNKFSRKDEGYLSVGYSATSGENYKSYADLEWEEIYLTHTEIKDLEIRDSKTKWRED